MTHATRLLLLFSLFPAISSHALAQQEDAGFEALIEDALKRQGGEAPIATPVPAAPGALDPAAPPPASGDVLQPVELTPRPYTPPAITPSPAGEAPGAAGQAPAGLEPALQAPLGEAPQDATGAATMPADPNAAVAAADERTRESLTPAEVNAAVFDEVAAAVKGANPIVLKAQILLDRAGASPGAIDGYSGGNLSKAVAAVETVLGLPTDGLLDKAVWDVLGGDAASAPLVEYTITPEDMAYPFAASIPADYAEQAKLPNLNYTSPEEMFGERFHMDVKLLTALNQGASFGAAGTVIWVAAVDGPPITGTIARIVADKGLRQVRAYDAADRLVVAYPATIGSPDNPSPSGNHTVKGVAPDPVYYYDPKNFVQGQNTDKLELPPGPNSPVGSVWIDLSEPSYGIHGTPEPTKIDKTGSHGCVRLTNWDAEELSKLVKPGIVVSFSG